MHNFSDEFSQQFFLSEPKKKYYLPNFEYFILPTNSRGNVLKYSFPFFFFIQENSPRISVTSAVSTTTGGIRENDRWQFLGNNFAYIQSTSS